MKTNESVKITPEMLEKIKADKRDKVNNNNVIRK